ncbi:ABC transporter permease [Aquabacterium sp. A7-Y]|uniref:ABC transporter permease n=1 Tax=Aquabacterium sp. A7-Y TaxID=1349605 RepID=UPI00223DDB06|nr:ABC transporter permease [Aquabacterium sp. A7-Y]MCW7539464.1 ABC transporter permease [Aquabacterium sp. A7-Y]
MVSIARANLIYEWRRYLAAVLAITFAGLLVVVQLALLLGLFGTVSVIVDKSAAHLWIGFRNTESVDLGRPISPTSDAAAWTHPGVERIERYVSAYGDLRRADGVPVSVLINAIDAGDQALAFRQLLTRSERALLREPGAILVDGADVAKLGAEVGKAIEINGKRAYIAGVVEGLRAVGGVNILTSFATARSLAPETAEQVTFYLVRLRPGFDTEDVAQQLADPGPLPRYSVWPAHELSVRSQSYWLLESGSGIGSGFASLLALIVGIAITSQTLAGAVIASVKEFAALRALGVSQRSLRQVVIEQSLWVGAVGLAVTAVLTLAIAWVGEQFRIAMDFPWWMLATVACLMAGIAVLSGLLALRPLLNAEPASLLR